jgi:hypothetical protein
VNVAAAERFVPATHHASIVRVPAAGRKNENVAGAETGSVAAHR